MNIKVNELMVANVMMATPRQTIGHVRQVMAKHRVNCLPVVDGEEELVGIITTTDLINGHADTTLISAVMPKKVYTVPQYADVSLAARVMRNQHIHHVIVTHEKKIVGILSSFDLLRMVEDHRFAMKNPPSPPKKHRRLGGGRREVDIHGHTE